jgi:hypothetical protein
MNSKLFHLGDILSITTGIMMSPRHMDGIADILKFMTGEVLFTHQLPRARLECAPFLLKQHPQLENISFEPITAENFTTVLEGLCAEYGDQLLVNKLPPHAHESIDPMSEMAEKVHPDKIFPVVMPYSNDSSF